jgi:hypothetical protein
MYLKARISITEGSGLKISLGTISGLQGFTGYWA